MRVLVVDDEPDILKALKTGLEAEYFSVDVAPDGERGSYLARTNDYDLIILDNALPKKCGAEVCAEIRSHGNAAPILFLSVLSDVTRKIELLHGGADDYMNKPFSMGEVVARARALLRRPRELHNDILRAADLVMDVQGATVERAGREVTLTCKEFCLLEYLLRNKGRVVSRGAIMEHVWDAEVNPFSNTIETHVLNLRKKLDRGYEVRLIHTISGRGYKLDDR